MSQHANAFRDLVYIEPVDIVLRQHEQALRLIFKEVCALEKFQTNVTLANQCSTPSSTHRMSSALLRPRLLLPTVEPH